MVMAPVIHFIVHSGGERRRGRESDGKSKKKIYKYSIKYVFRA